MRKTLVGLLVLGAILCCTLIPGTPVNSDPSPAARTAGIHLATPATHSRIAAQDVSQALALLVVLVTLVALAQATATTPLRGRERRQVPRSLLWSRSGRRRGPPLCA